ncbi:MAG: hypothetical protein ACI845_004110 [Gammaproteobacteria bacterium]|jgi:hypothetical protein
MLNDRVTFFALLFFVTIPTFAEDGTPFQVEPQKCVTLQQGRTCYLDVTVTWQNKMKGDYCLVQESILEPLKCWNNADNGQFKFEFSGDRTHSLHLVKQPNKRIIHSSEITVKWVYKSRNQASVWRVF